MLTLPYFLQAFGFIMLSIHYLKDNREKKRSDRTSPPLKGRHVNSHWVKISPVWRADYSILIASGLWAISSVTLDQALDLTFIITKRTKQWPPSQGTWGCMGIPANWSVGAVTGARTSQVTVRDLSLTINKLLHQHCMFQRWMDSAEAISKPSLSATYFHKQLNSNSQREPMNSLRHCPLFCPRKPWALSCVLEHVPNLQVKKMLPG